MSGYRNYVPWKSSLPYKSGSGSTYSSRDDVNTSDVKTTPRFGSLASPAAYRPSYSGGTYRSVKRDTPLVSTPYVSRYGSSYSSAKDEKDTKPPETAKKIQPTQSKYLGSASNKENSLEPKISRYSTSTGNLAKYGTKSRDPSPAPDRRSNIAVTRAKSRDPSPVVDRRHTPSFSTSTSNLSKYGRRSRDPSPIADIRLSAASPARSNLRARSRDPSPVDSRFKGSVGSTSSSYGSTYRLGQRSSTNYGSKYGSGSPSISSTSRNNLSDKALSYMSVSDFRARSVSRTHDCTKKLEKLSLSEKESDRSARRARAEAISDLDNKISDHCENETKKVEVEPEVFVPVTVVTRGTSPTPPGASSFVRSRRTDLAKTIEKTIQRSSRKPSCSDKEIQSDRLDDSTRYSRFSSAGRMSSIPWSPYTETKFSRSDSSKYSGSSGSGKPVKSEVETVEKKKKDESSSKSSSSSTRSNTKQDKSKSSSELKSSKSSTKQFSTSSKQKSTESLANSSSRALPPAVPKVESPTKSMSSSSSSRWPNKDFRKSALNVGPTDRPRKSRTPSTGTDTEEKCDQAKAIGSPAFGRGERSPSVGSEASGVSTATATSSSSSASSSDEQKRCNRANGKTSPVVQLQSQPDPEDDESPSVAVPIENTGSYNKITSSGFGMRGDHQQQQQQQPNQPMLNFRQVQSPEYDSPVESPSAQLVAKNEEAKSFLIRKLGSVSNFFVNRTQDTSGETIYLDNSSGNSNSDGLKEDTTTASVSQLLSPTVAITSNTKTDSDLDESSWWQNTSQQINTESALDVRDDMKYKLRHIDSGEVAWWMQNENEDDTIADDLKTLNQQDDPDRSENTDRSCTNEQRSESREKSWWPTSNSGSATAAEKPPNRIRRIESGERAWWLNDNNSPDSPKEVSDPAQNQRLSAVNEDSTSEFQRGDPDPNQASNQYNVPWWMADNSQQEPEKVVSPFKVRPSQSGEKDWWLNNSSNESPSRDSIAQREYRYSIPAINKIRHVDSGEKAWWLQDESADSGGQVNDATETLAPEDEEIKRASSNYYYNNSTNNNHQEAALSQSDTRIPPLGDRASPEGLEDNSVDRKSPHRNTNHNDTNRNIPTKRNRSDKAFQLFISRHRNIDELLGGSCRPLSPLMNRFGGKDGFFEEISPNQVRIHDSTAQMPVIQRMERDEWDFVSTNQPYQQQSQHELDDAAVQVYKDGDYGAYLDLESSLAEQAEEIEGLDSSRKNSLVVRTQLSVRVHTIIEKLLSSEGSELRRALFSLKQIFQEDKDLVHGFVALGGLNCLVRVGNVADQNYQNYILRALGQVMLYVDGMNGVMRHSPTIQWLYSLIASKYRLVVKTALKLLLVFVEYVESNCNLLVLAVHAVDKTQGTLPWSNIMKLLKDYENADTELLIYATSLINKTLSGLSDQDSFYDESDFLEQQGMEGVIQRYMSRPGTDLDLLDQLQLYEAVLKFEDGETDGIRIPDNSVRKTLRLRANVDSTERRKSRRHSTGTSPSTQQNLASPKRYTPPTHGVLDEDSSSSNNSNEFSAGVFRECKGQREGAGVTPGLRRRRERAERQKSFMREQQEAAANGIRSPFDKNGEQNGLDSECEEKKLVLQIRRDHTVKDLTQKLTNLPTSPQEDKTQNRIGDMTGLISKAKEGLAKSKSKGDISRSPSVDQEIKKVETKKSENELHWEELVKSMSRPLTLCDLDFTDLNDEDEKDVLAPRGLGGAIPPPPPPIGIPPPISGMGPPFNGKLPPGMSFPPPPTNLVPPPGFGYASLNKQNGDNSNSSIKKNKKTVKLFWKEVREDMIPPTISKTIWDELPKATVDIQKLEHLFESRAKDLITKEKQQELNKNKEIIVLDHKRSNAINIAMTKLPPPRAIKAAILKMDQTVVTREGIDKLLNMLPTDEERGKIQEAQMSNPELPLGSAEQFLLTLSSISELSARLKLWAFKLDFENTEKEIAEPLNDLKQGVELLKANKTFKCILSTLLSVGIFLNGAPVKGFQIEYLAKVPEVKDTVHKHSLLHHLCHMVMESSPDTTDLYSEIGPITRASKADFTDLAHNLAYLETECKASWDRLKLIAKHDCPPQLKQKLVDFLAECAERIIILEIIHRRVINRYRKFLLWLGVPQHRVAESRPNEFSRIVSEFALEYRTTRERVQQQIEKKANHRERNKTRGKMIIDIGKFRTQEDRADAELKQLLGSPNPRTENQDGILTWRRRRAENLRSPITKQNEESFTDGDDEILESLVKTATKAPGSRPTPRERKRTRHADRKSLKRSRTREGFTVERNAASPEH